jgi:hypothetical protein
MKVWRPWRLWRTSTGFSTFHEDGIALCNLQTKHEKPGKHENTWKTTGKAWKKTMTSMTHLTSEC